ncbi:O-antigen ligase family protein [Sphingobium aquiterrae]|uniref:O-antigen ligase family protein n=1 Tax=Sphingobium aquiterrae TaxID=2038656 RepID=UPI003016FC41
MDVYQGHGGLQSGVPVNASSVLPEGDIGSAVRRGRRLAFQIIDHLAFVAFLIYAMHVLVSPLDGQVIAQMGMAHSGYYGQLITGKVGQVIFLLYLALRADVVLKILPAFLSVLGGLAVLAILSTAWSIAPLDTIHHAGDLFFCVLFPALFVRLFGFERTLWLTWITLSAILLVSALLAAAGSEYALMGGLHEGRWRGLFQHKNAFAPFALCVGLFSGTLPASVVRVPWLAHLVAALAVLCILMSDSATTIIALPLAIAAAVAVHFFLRSMLAPFLIFVIELAGIAATAVASYGIAVIVFGALGRQMNFTGRSKMWDAALPYSFDAPLGYGYGTGGGMTVLNAARRAGFAVAPSLHSGYLTMAMDLGWLAVGIFALFLVSKFMLIGARERAMGRYAVMAAAIAMANICFAITESDYGAYLGPPLFLIMLLSHAPTPRGASVFTAIDRHKPGKRARQ